MDRSDLSLSFYSISIDGSDRPLIDHHCKLQSGYFNMFVFVRFVRCSCSVFSHLNKNKYISCNYMQNSGICTRTDGVLR